MNRLLLCIMMTGFIIAGMPVRAQTGTLSGTLTETGTTKPLAGATVRLFKPNETTSKGAYSNGLGKYVVKNIEPGIYRVVFSSVGFKTVEQNPVAITAGETTLDISLEIEPINLNSVVVTASRKQEKALEAPASVSVITPVDIAERPALVPTEHLRGIAGVDFAQTGISQQTTVTRGFNNVFSGMLLTLADYRVAGVPSLRVNVPYFIPLVNEDIERMELVRGPGSALYGPNATQGVLNIISRSPFSSQGTSLSVAGGERSLFNGTIRHANTIGENFGFKISGQYIRAEDWQYKDSLEETEFAEAIAAGEKADTLKIAKRDPIHERFSVEGRMDYIFTDNLSANISSGITQTIRSVEMTGVGAGQVQDWAYSYIQGRVDFDKLFIQGFMNLSDAGETYLLRDGAKITDNSTLIGARIQHSYEFNDIQSFTYGGDATLTSPNTEGTITGRNEANDDIDEFGAYLQSETHLLDNLLDVLIAGRVDIHSRLDDPVFSPRAALVFKPDQNNNLRFTFNRAFSTPSTNELFLDIVAAKNAFGLPSLYAVDVKASGVPEGGYTFDRSNGGLSMHSQFSPNRSVSTPINTAGTFWAPATLLVIGSEKDPQKLQELQKYLTVIPAPSASSIEGTLASLNPSTQQFNPVADVKDIAELKPTINQTLEVGYKGIAIDALQIGVDVYYSQVTDVIGPLQVFTPNVFFKADQVKDYLKPKIKEILLNEGKSEATAESEAENLSSNFSSRYARIPVGTVTPKEATDPTAVMLAYRNAGNIDMIGTDIALEYALGKTVGITGSYSLLKLLDRSDYDNATVIDGTYIEKIDGVSDYALNAPAHKAAIGLKFREPEMGLRAGIQYRYNDGFRMNSGVYIGQVKHSNIVDVTLGYDIPWIANLKLDVSATNILDNRTQYFVGAPEIGRLVMARLGYNF